MKKLAVLGALVAFAVAGCDDADPVGTAPDSAAEAAYADLIANVQAVPMVVVHPAPGSSVDGSSSGVPPVAAAVTDKGGRTRILNGSFETGDFSGWTTVTTASPFVDWTVSGAGDGSGFFPPTQPQDGNFVAWNGFDGLGPMEFAAYQDVNIGQGLTIIKWMDRAQWDFTLGEFATQPRTAQVQVLDPQTNAVLETLYSLSTGTQADAVSGDTGWQEHMADLSAYRGQTVRLSFKQSIPEFFTGPGQYELDAIAVGDGNGAEFFTSPYTGFSHFDGENVCIIRNFETGDADSSDWVRLNPDGTQYLHIQDAVATITIFTDSGVLVGEGRWSANWHFDAPEGDDVSVARGTVSDGVDTYKAQCNFTRLPDGTVETNRVVAR